MKTFVDMEVVKTISRTTDRETTFICLVCDGRYASIASPYCTPDNDIDTHVESAHHLRQPLDTGPATPYDWMQKARVLR